MNITADTYLQPLNYNYWKGAPKFFQFNII